MNDLLTLAINSALNSNTTLGKELTAYVQGFTAGYNLANQIAQQEKAKNEKTKKD